MKNSNSLLKFTLKTTLPVFFGYCPLGIAFGLLMSQTDYSIITTPIMSIFIYAGAAQFLAVNFFLENAAIFDVIFITFLMNSRHFFYGLSFLEKYRIDKWFRPYLIFSLTDETYGLLTTVEIPKEIDRSKAYFFISFFNQFYWISGSIIGVLFGKVITLDMTGLDFSLTALFIVLLIEQIKHRKKWIPFAIAFICSIAALLIVGKSNMLLVSIILSIFLIIPFRRTLSNDVK